MKGPAATLSLSIIAIIVVLGMLVYIFIFKTHSAQTNTQPIATSVSPTTAVKDFAPSLSANQKTTILIQQSDSSEIKYIVPTDQVDTYIKSLPEGAHVISKSP